MGVLNSASVLAQVISINLVYQFIVRGVNKRVEPGQANESVAIGIAATSPSYLICFSNKFTFIVSNTWVLGGLFSVLAVIWCLFAVREKPGLSYVKSSGSVINHVLLLHS